MRDAGMRDEWRGHAGNIKRISTNDHDVMQLCISSPIENIREDSCLLFLCSCLVFTHQVILVYFVLCTVINVADCRRVSDWHMKSMNII